jgi:hypothetical protein
MTNRKQDRRPRPWAGRALIESVRIESAKGTITAGCGCCSSPGSYLTNLPLFMGRSPRTAADRMRTEMIFGAHIAELSGGRNTGRCPDRFPRPTDLSEHDLLVRSLTQKGPAIAEPCRPSRTLSRARESPEGAVRFQVPGPTHPGFLRDRGRACGVGPSRACAWPMRGCAGCTPVPCWCRRRRRTPRRVVG